MTVALISIGGVVSTVVAVFAEVFPTAIRAAGVGVGVLDRSGPVRWHGAVPPDVVGLDRASRAFDLYAIGLVVISIVTVVLMPETRGRDLAAGNRSDPVVP